MRWMPAAAAGLAAVALLKPPAIDEESYLWLGRTLEWSNPYGWHRAWQGGDGWIYAHPPLHLWWMKALSVLGAVPAMRGASLVWAALYGWASALWMRRTAHHPELAGLAWLASTTVVLGLQDSLMIDLPMVALATAAIALFREAAETDDRRTFALAGVLFGLAVETKYPAALLAPVFVTHMLRHGWRNAFALPALTVIIGVEGGLFARYGELHPLAAWMSRDAVAYGPVEGRVLGVLARASLLPSAVALLYARPIHAATGLGLAVAAVAWVRPGLESTGAVAALLGFAAAGGMSLSRAAEAAFSPPHRRRKGDRSDGLLLGGTVLACALGVVAFHNYASARYLLLAATPTAILLARGCEEVEHGKRVLLGSSVIAGVAALWVAVADWRFVAAEVEVAELAASRFEVGTFVGEWSFRHTLEARGWTALSPDGPAPLPGTRVLVDDASGGHAPPGWEPVDRVESEDRSGLRVVDPRRGAGLYAETLGALPVSFGFGPLAGATLYEVR
jgi:4-amino-4-deoxy-L-arabinose transferase-like glycosyltransferase